MKMTRSPYLILVFAIILFTGCSKDEESPVLPKSTEYQLTSMNDSGVTGKATFTDDGQGKTEVLIELTGTTTAVHPADIRFNSAEEGGPVALTLKSCECSVGHTVVTKLDTGTPISYAGLLKLDGHISIHESPGNMGTIVAVANIGLNAN
jgi:hypothetical protein